LFQNRYKSVLCEEEAYLLALVRYIHLNPIRANIILTLEELDRYPYSGHRAVIGKASYDWMGVPDVLAEFGTGKRNAKAAYRQFVREGLGQKHDPTFSGGGLSRSHSGWSQVLSRRRKKQEEAYDERILGSGDFVHSVLKDAEEKQLRQVKLRRTGLTIDRIVKQEVDKSKISAKELQAGSRRQIVSDARATIARRAVEELGLSCAEVARHLGVCTSSISRVVSKVDGRER
jgi:putative transposase